MRALQAVLIVLSLADFVAAERAPDEMAAVDVNHWISFFDRLVDAVVQAGPACEKMAVDVSTLIDHNQDAIDAVRAARAAKRKLPEAAQQHMLAGVQRMGPAMKKCATHPKVIAAFAKLDLNRPR